MISATKMFLFFFRNIFVLGISFHLGIMIPYALTNGLLVIDTGIPDLNVIIGVILGSSLTVGAIVSTIFDNTLPGSKVSIYFC